MSTRVRRSRTFVPSTTSLGTTLASAATTRNLEQEKILPSTSPLRVAKTYLHTTILRTTKAKGKLITWTKIANKIPTIRDKFPQTRQLIPSDWILKQCKTIGPLSAVECQTTGTVAVNSLASMTRTLSSGKQELGTTLWAGLMQPQEPRVGKNRFQINNTLLSFSTSGRSNTHPSRATAPSKSHQKDSVDRWLQTLISTKIEQETMRTQWATQEWVTSQTTTTLNSTMATNPSLNFQTKVYQALDTTLDHMIAGLNSRIDSKMKRITSQATLTTTQKGQASSTQALLQTTRHRMISNTITNARA